MRTGMLYHSFVCFVSGLVSLTVFWQLRKIRKKKEVRYHQALDYFALFLSLQWISLGIRIFFGWLDMPELDRLTFKWFTGPLAYFHLLPGFYYFGWSFFKNNKKIRLLFNGFFTCTTLLTVFTLYKYGFEVPELTYWGNNIIPNRTTNQIFTYAILLPVVPCIIIEFFRRLRNWRQTGNSIEKQLLGFSVGFMVYAITGTFDVLGSIQDWMILLSRSATMLAPLIFYFFATMEE